MIATTSIAWTAIILFAGTMAYAGIKDVETMTITNRVTLSLAAGFFLFSPAAGLGMEAMLSSALAAMAVLAGAFVLFAFGWIGGGDAKLSAVAVLWLGSDMTLDFVVCASVFGTALTLALLLFRRIALPSFLQVSGWPSRLHSEEAGVPYGPALAAAALFLIPQSHWAAAIIGAS